MYVVLSPVQTFVFTRTTPLNQNTAVSRQNHFHRARRNHTVHHINGNLGSEKTVPRKKRRKRLQNGDICCPQYNPSPQNTVQLRIAVAGGSQAMIG